MRGGGSRSPGTGKAQLCEGFRPASAGPSPPQSSRLSRPGGGAGFAVIKSAGTQASAPRPVQLAPRGRPAGRSSGGGSPGSAPAPARGPHFVLDAPPSALWAGAGGPSASARPEPRGTFSARRGRRPALPGMRDRAQQRRRGPRDRSAHAPVSSPRAVVVGRGPLSGARPAGPGGRDQPRVRCARCPGEAVGGLGGGALES